MELTKYCSKMCHILKDVIQGRNMGSLSGPGKKAIKDLGGYVDLVQSSPSIITDDIRIMRDIESIVRQRRGRAHSLLENHPISTEERLIAWRAELPGILRILNVRDCKFTAPTISKQPQGEVMPGDAPAVSKIRQRVQRSANAETPTSVLMVVCCFLPLHTAPC